MESGSVPLNELSSLLPPFYIELSISALLILSIVKDSAGNGVATGGAEEYRWRLQVRLSIASTRVWRPNQQLQSMPKCMDLLEKSVGPLEMPSRTA